LVDWFVVNVGMSAGRWRHCSRKQALPTCASRWKSSRTSVTCRVSVSAQTDSTPWLTASRRWRVVIPPHSPVTS